MQSNNSYYFNPNQQVNIAGLNFSSNQSGTVNYSNGSLSISVGGNIEGCKPISDYKIVNPA